MTVSIYADTSKRVGDKDHLKVFVTADAADEWFTEHDPEGVAFEYTADRIERSRSGSFRSPACRTQQPESVAEVP